MLISGSYNTGHEIHYLIYIFKYGARGGVVVKALRYKQVAGSNPDGVIGIFH
jgi:hypothetical protein